LEQERLEELIAVATWVEDVMTRHVISVRKGAGYKDILQVMRREHFSARAAALTAAELMTRPAITISPEASVADAARTMHAKHVKRLPVVTAAGRLVGIVSRSDILRVYDRLDDDIRKEIEEGVIKGGFCLDSLAFNVTVSGDVVTLVGQIEREPVALSLLQAVRCVDGVVAVREKLSYPRR
jgi:predicted transcriptional regulator